MKNHFSPNPFLFMGLFVVTFTGCDKHDSLLDRLWPKAYTTVERTIQADPLPGGEAPDITDPASFESKGYGKWHYGDGLPFDKKTDLMPADYNSSLAENEESLLSFFAFTDIHITDEESPAQAIYFRRYLGMNAVSVYAPLMLYTTQVLDAAVNTVNKIHKRHPLDFGIMLGDLSNNGQHNELRWFIDIMDGKAVHPDSGADDDPVPGPGNDHQDPFNAVGLDPAIPWYAVVGNHDHFYIGSKPYSERLRRALLGEQILHIGNILSDDPAEMDKETISTGSIAGNSVNCEIIGEGIVAQMTDFPTIPADQDRYAITVDDFIAEMSNTTSLPAGHGFEQANPENRFKGCYSYIPKMGLPLKVIVLDNTQENSDVSRIYGHGSLKNGRYEWLIKQLQTGQKEGKLMIIAAHVPIGVAFGEEVGWFDEAYERALIKELKTYPNLILWISGHRHLNTVKAFPSDDPVHPENSFWAVETKSLREFPQQFRVFDIVLNKDKTLSIFATNVDPDIEENPLAAVSRSLALASQQIYNLMEPFPGSGPISHNVELIIPLSPEMQKKLAK